jgi:hypothetical protein
MGRWLIALLLLTCAGARAADSCQGLPNAHLVPAGEFKAPDGSRLRVPTLCRIQGNSFELWLPAANWNGRYYQLGTGGFAGSIPYAALAAEVSQGNAVAATDTGHRGSPFDASWALGAPERVSDYGYRSVETTSRAAGNLIARFYGKPARHRYFAGCSNGGRQALMAAQRSPQLWDGILAGAPAYNWTRQLSAFAWIQHRLRTSSGAWIGAEKLPAIQRWAVCAGDPANCRPDPARLLCTGPESDACLSRPQVESLRAIIHGPPGYFGYEAASAAVPGNWERWVINGDPNAQSQLKFAEQFYRFLVFGDSGWDLSRWRGMADIQRAENLAGKLDATDTNLRPLQQHGGKLLMYIGWADAVISPRAAINYYDKVSRSVETESFFRLYMVPGMTHCQGGSAPDAFGQSSVSPPMRDDAQHSIRRALEEWVEKGTPPRELLAAKYADDDPAKGVEATQALCPYPAHAVGYDCAK